MHVVVLAAELDLVLAMAIRNAIENVKRVIKITLVVCVGGRAQGVGAGDGNLRESAGRRRRIGVPDVAVQSLIVYR